MMFRSNNNCSKNEMYRPDHLYREYEISNTDGPVFLFNTVKKKQCLIINLQNIHSPKKIPNKIMSDNFMFYPFFTSTWKNIDYTVKKKKSVFSCAICCNFSSPDGVKWNSSNMRSKNQILSVMCDVQPIAKDIIQTSDILRHS